MPRRSTVHAALIGFAFCFWLDCGISDGMRIAIATALVLAAAAPALAAATPWQDVAPGARLRLITSDVRRPDGTTLVGLELQMPDAYKTYWRLPGESGIPTQVDIAGSQGLRDPVIRWPFPSTETTAGALDHVYHGNTVLPVELKLAGDAPVVEAAVTMGVCSEVCVPVRARFSLPLSFAAADAGQSLRLQQAVALAPIPWTSARPAFGPVSYDPAQRALRVPLADPAVDPASVIAAASDPTAIFGTPQKSPDGHSIVLPLRGEPRRSDWAKTPVQLTFMTAMGSFEVSEQVTSPQP